MKVVIYIDGHAHYLPEQIQEEVHYHDTSSEYYSPRFQDPHKSVWKTCCSSCTVLMGVSRLSKFVLMNQILVSQEPYIYVYQILTSRRRESRMVGPEDFFAGQKWEPIN